MSKEEKCPKCGGIMEIYRPEFPAFFLFYCENADKRKNTRTKADVYLNTGMMIEARHICTKCNYIEFYLVSSSDVRLGRQAWKSIVHTKEYEEEL